MLSNDYIYPKINNLRVFLNCFYVYLISSAFEYAKQVIIQYPHSILKLYPKLYVSIRSVVSAFCICLYSILIIYSLWFERVGSLVITIILFIFFFIIRLIFDIYGYSTNSFEYSLYPPFQFITTNLTQINITIQKQMLDEITDFSIELLINIIGILLTVFIIIRMLRKKLQRRQRGLEALRLAVIRRKTM
jgi:hypothetical protein